MTHYAQSDIPQVTGYDYIGTVGFTEWYRPIYDIYQEASKQYERAIEAMNPPAVTVTSDNCNEWVRLK